MKSTIATIALLVSAGVVQAQTYVPCLSSTISTLPVGQNMLLSSGYAPKTALEAAWNICRGRAIRERLRDGSSGDVYNWDYDPKFKKPCEQAKAAWYERESRRLAESERQTNSGQAKVDNEDLSIIDRGLKDPDGKP